MVGHRIELHFDKRAPIARQHWGVCECGHFDSGRMMNPGMVHSLHGAHLDKERAKLVDPVDAEESPTKD